MTKRTKSPIEIINNIYTPNIVNAEVIINELAKEGWLICGLNYKEQLDEIWTQGILEIVKEQCLKP